MKIKQISIYLLLVSILAFSQCTSHKQVSETPTPSLGIKPNWVTKRPTNPSYYIGVAMASKTASPTTYQLEAQRNALNELASSIEVKVKSNSMLFTFEEENIHRDEFKEFIQVKTNQKLENFEEVAVWENDFEYWVYYRLSIEQYKKDKQAKIDKAINMSLNLLDQYEDEWSKGGYHQGMMYLFDALRPIKPYLGEPLPVTMNGSKDVYLGNYILTQISQGVREFKIVPEKSDIEMSWGAGVASKYLSFVITDRQGKAISQIPVKFTYSEGMIRPREGVSGVNGLVYTEIRKITSANNLQSVTAEIDFQAMILGKKRPDEIEKLIFAEIKPQKTAIQLSVSAPYIYVYSIEKSLGKGKGSSLKTAFINQATELGFRIAKYKKNADLNVYIESNTTQAGVNYGLNNVYLNATIKVINVKDDKVVYQDKLTNIKGVSDSYQKASTAAYGKGKEQITKKIVPRFYRKYMNN